MSSSNLVHELKNQLGIIVGFVELLIVESGADDDRRADLLEIQKAVQRAIALLPQLVGQPDTP